MKIHVKRKHIKAGKKGDPYYCPIALAIKELKPNYQHIHVGGCDISYIHKDTEYWLDLPEEASDFIDNFDEGDKVKPFTFKATKQ